MFIFLKFLIKQYQTQLQECGAVPVFCSVMGVVARGTDFMSKGFSEGSKVYWCRDFSSPGMETDKPDSSRRHTHILISAQTPCVCVFIYH